MITRTPSSPDFLASHARETVAVAALLSTGQLTLYEERSPHTVGLLGVYGESGHLTLTEEADAASWHSFLSFLRLKSIITDAFTADKLSLSGERAKLLELLTPSLAPADTHLCFCPSLRDVYALMHTAFPVPDADLFVADMQLRINHGVARAVTYEINGSPVGTASVFFESDTVCFLGGIVTDSRYRGRGVAKALVSALCRDALSRGKRPVLSCVNPVAERLYASLGFVQVGERVTVTLSEGEKP